jgi:hypothetical protein
VTSFSPFHLLKGQLRRPKKEKKRKEKEENNFLRL